MTIDKDTNAPQYTKHELEHMAGKIIKPKKKGDCILYAVNIDDLNMFLRAHFIRTRRKPKAGK